MGTMWFPCGTTLCPHRNHMVFTLKSCGDHMDTIWYPCGCGHNVVTMWTPHGLHVDTKTRSYITSVAIRSRKNYQSLNACNFLNNGPIFNPQKVLESSWSPLSDKSIILLFPLFEMMVSFPFQSNLTPMSHDHHKLTNQEP